VGSEVRPSVTHEVPSSPGCRVIEVSSGRDPQCLHCNAGCRACTGLVPLCTQKGICTFAHWSHMQPSGCGEGRCRSGPYAFEIDPCCYSQQASPTTHQHTLYARRHLFTSFERHYSSGSKGTSSGQPSAVSARHAACLTICEAFYATKIPRSDATGTDTNSTRHTSLDTCSIQHCL